MPPEGVLWAFAGAAVSSLQRGLEAMSLVSLQTSDAEEDQMKHWTLSMMGVVTFVGISLTASSAMADHDDRLSVSVAFGFGLNTAQQGNRANHVVLPKKIKVKQGGVVHFLVAGFHQVVVYNPETKHDDIDVPGLGTFINDPITQDPTTQFYLGINPAGGPPPGTPGTTNPSNAMNRVESVSFTEPGTYLVICNIRTHFLDGMFAVVKVKEDKDDDD
jgi:plastocyanin